MESTIFHPRKCKGNLTNSLGTFAQLFGVGRARKFTPLTNCDALLTWGQGTLNGWPMFFPRSERNGLLHTCCGSTCAGEDLWPAGPRGALIWNSSKSALTHNAQLACREVERTHWEGSGKHASMGAFARNPFCVGLSALSLLLSLTRLSALTTLSAFAPLA